MLQFVRCKILYFFMLLSSLRLGVVWIFVLFSRNQLEIHNFAKYRHKTGGWRKLKQFPLKRNTADVSSNNSYYGLFCSRIYFHSFGCFSNKLYSRWMNQLGWKSIADANKFCYFWMFCCEIEVGVFQNIWIELSCCLGCNMYVLVIELTTSRFQYA